MTGLRPSEIAGSLLAALEASEGRRKRRVRNTTADSIGLGIKRDLLVAISTADPEPHDFERWLMDYCAAAGSADGPIRAMALSIWDEWRMAEESPDFRMWLAQGAPSDDREGSDNQDRLAAVRRGETNERSS